MLNTCVFSHMFNRERLSELLDRSGLRRESVSERADISVQTLYNYENGKRVPTLEILIRVARALGTSVAYLVEETDDPAPPLKAQRPAIDLSEFEGIVPKETIDKIVNAPFRASINEEQARNMKDEEILLALQETQERIILYKLRDELKKELERRKNK